MHILRDTLENIVEVRCLEVFGAAFERGAVLLNHLPHVRHRAFIEVRRFRKNLFAQGFEAKTVQAADHAVKIPRRRERFQLLCHAKIRQCQLPHTLKAVQRREFRRL